MLKKREPLIARDSHHGEGGGGGGGGGGPLTYASAVRNYGEINQIETDSLNSTVDAKLYKKNDFLLILAADGFPTNLSRLVS